MGSRYQITTRSAVHNARTPLTPQSERNPRSSQLRPRTFEKRYHTGILEPLRCQLLLRQEEGQKAQTSTRLPTHQQMDQEKSKRISTNSASHRPSEGLLSVHKSRHQMGV